MLKIVFMGTPDFARDSLKAIDEAGHSIELVITNIDKPKGRGMKLMQSPVKEYAISKSFEIEQPQKVRGNEDLIKKIKNINPDVICVVAYGKILPKEILEIPKLGCINVHGSLLPQYRGAAPIQWAVLNGDKETGITTMYMDEGMDTGDMIFKSKVTIGEDETTGELWDKLSKIGAKLLVETLEKVENKTAPREKQGNNYTVAPMLKKEMAKIDWENQTARNIKNLVRGLNPIMGAYSFLGGKKIKFWKVQKVEEKDFEQQFSDINLKDKKTGEVLIANDKQGLYIKTIDSILQILEIQGENAKRMPIDAFLRGNTIELGKIFV